ncbi:MAG: SOS response-associated peptidase family protein [Gammaproteobacteria bacterium]
MAAGGCSAARDFHHLTTNSDSLVGEIHDRMLVILPREHNESWPNAGDREVARLRALLVSHPPEAMMGYPVTL